MGLNFHVRCKTHRVVAMIARGDETSALHQFYKTHEPCRKADPSAVEVEADGYSEKDWMTPEFVNANNYTDLGLY